MSYVSITWSASVGATQYTVYRSLVSGQRGSAVASVPGTSAVDTTVVPGTTYWYGVTASNVVGQSPLSLQASVTVPALPAQTITSFTASPSSIVSGALVTLAWATANATSVRLNNVVVEPESPRPAGPTP